MKKFVCIALAACFVVALVSFSSSAAVENVVTPLTLNAAFFEFNYLYYPQFGYNSYFTSHGSSISYDTDLGITSPSNVFKNLVLAYAPFYHIPEYSGRPLSLSLNIDFDVTQTGYLSLVPSDVDMSDSAIFTDCILRLNFSDGTSVDLHQDSFILKDDDTGVVLDPTSDSYWRSIVGNVVHFSIYSLFDVTPYTNKTIEYLYILFPASSGNIYYSNDNLSEYLVLDNFSTTLDFAYTPFNDVVQDDLTDIKTQLGTIDQDVNRVQQDVSDLKDTIEDFQQDLTSSDSSISSDISDKEDIIDSIQDQMNSNNSFLEDPLNDMITAFPEAQDPFHDAPSPDNFFAVDFIQQLWSFIKAQTVFFDFIFLGLCFCLATFILRR